MIWLVNGNPLSKPAVAGILHAGQHDGVFVSLVSAWEVGMASRRRSEDGKSRLFAPDPKTWFRRALTGVGIRQALNTFDIAIDAAILPGDIHGDPADRLMVATARMMNVPLITRDRKLIAYAEQGHVEVIAC